jgi:hypothetical protein
MGLSMPYCGGSWANKSKLDKGVFSEYNLYIINEYLECKGKPIER